MFSSLRTSHMHLRTLIQSRLENHSRTRGMTGSPGKERLTILDTTLRDGEQAAGVNLNVEDKVAIARQLHSLGVDICEAGFAASSKGAFDAMTAVAKEVASLNGYMRVAGLARSNFDDIRCCHEAIHHAPRHRIHIFFAASDIHLKHKLKISREELLKRSVESVRFAKSLTDDIQFSLEDVPRSDPDFICQVLQRVIAAGATTLGIGDTVGYSTPQEYGSLISYLIKYTRGSYKAVFSTHCHNDLGLATANTLAGIEAGARQVDVSVNGIGERAGNAALEEVVMAIRTRPNLFPVSVDHIITTEILKCSRLVSQRTGLSVQSSKAIVGENAFAHSSGVHQDGLLKRLSTYEIMRPEDVGHEERKLVLGRLSSKKMYKKRLNDLGYENISAAQLDTLVAKFKAFAEKNGEGLSDNDLRRIASEAEPQT